MTFTDEIEANYTDALGLVSPHPTTKDDPRSSDNGVMYTCEYLILLALQPTTQYGSFTYSTGRYTALSDCQIEPGLFARAPKDTGEAPPDDMYALAAMNSVNKCPLFCESIYQYGMKHYGAFNPKNPGTWTTQAFLWRQPQLLAAVMAGAGRKVPFILSFISAAVVFFSCRKAATLNTDPRRLSWLLIKALSPTSRMMRFVAKGWYKRLYRDYGPMGMRAVRQIYYLGTRDRQHPFVTYSVD